LDIRLKITAAKHAPSHTKKVKVETGKMSEKRKRVEVFLLLQLGFFYFSFSFSQSYVRIISLGYVFKKDRVKIKHQKNEFQGS